MSTAPESLDPVTWILLAEAGELTGDVAVLDDVDGAVTAALLAAEARTSGTRVRVWCDDVRAEIAAADAIAAGADASVGVELVDTPAQALTGARTVLWRLPRSLGAVDEYAQLIAALADPGVRMIGAERDKHLNRSMNDVLARHFTQVNASLGRRKARALLASGPRPGAPSWPRTARLDTLDLDVVAHGATFNGNRLDRGTALLVSRFEALPPASTAIDLGCGSGILAALLARRGAAVTGVDVAWSATDATRRTAQADGLAVDVQRRDGLIGWSEPVDLVVTNPPFHVRGAKDTSPTRELFAQAARALRGGGELWCVYNAHLPYLPWLRDAVGPTTIEARDRGYLATRSVVSGRA